MSELQQWLESLSPWPEEFGLDRMKRLLADLGEPLVAVTVTITELQQRLTLLFR